MPDRVAFESLLEYGPAAWRLSVRMLGSEDSADDVVQEAFLAAMRQLASGHPPENTRAWFLGIVANVARKHVRSEMNRRRREMVVGAEERSGSPPEDGLPGGELTAALRVAMAGLEEKHRVPVALCCEEGLTRREAAAVLGIPERTVSKYVSDGLARLREALRRAGYDAGDAAVIGGLAHTAPPVPPPLGEAVEKLLAERAAGAANATQSTEPAGAETASGEAASGKPAGPLETGGEPAGGELVGGEGGSGGLVGATGASVPVAATGGRTVMRIMVAVAIVVLTAAAGIVAPEFFDRDPSLLPAGTGGGGASAGNEAGTADGPGTGTPGNAAGGITILSNDTLWRCHKAYRWNEVRTADGKIEMRMIFAYGLGLVGSPWGPEGAAKPLSTATFSLPPADWTSVEFDDSRWERRQAPMRPDNMECGFGQTYCVALIAARGKFEVKDPAQVREVNLSLRYYGGAVVYVNGKEVARGHVPADKPGMETPAEDYPLEAYVNPDGKLMRPNAPKNQDRLAMR
ncbi:MAG: RNA polymerase sigma factor, partial [Planctomycetota bacterium]|nr:RNA polymerase sigma factor [Planctomycetota bacterium]